MTPILGLLGNLDLVRLDERIREQLLTHLLDGRLRIRRVGRVDVEVDDLADACVVYRETEMAERRPDRLALRIEDPRLRPHENRGSHPSPGPSTTVDGSPTYEANGIVVRRSNASTYFARVPSTMSMGISGPGSVLSQ